METVCIKGITVEVKPCRYTVEELGMGGYEYTLLTYGKVKQLAEDHALSLTTQDLEEVADQYEDESDIYSTHNSDIFIEVCSALMSEGETATLEARGDNPFYIAHDLYHAMKDVAGGVIYVDGDIEAERIVEAMEYCKDKSYYIEWEKVLGAIDREYREKVKASHWRNYTHLPEVNFLKEWRKRYKGYNWSEELYDWYRTEGRYNEG